MGLFVCALIVLDEAEPRWDNPVNVKTWYTRKHLLIWFTYFYEFYFQVAQRCKNKTSRNEFSLENSFDRLGFCVKSLRLEKGYSRHACINLVESACVGERSLVRLKLYHVLMIGWSFYSVVEWKHTTASWVEILEQKQNAKNPFVSCRNENNFFCQETSPMVYVDRFLRVKYFQISGSLPSTASSSQEWINHISPIEASIV